MDWVDVQKDMVNYTCFHCGEHFRKSDKIKCRNEYCEIMTTDDGQLRTEYSTPEIMKRRTNAIIRGMKKAAKSK